MAYLSRSWFLPKLWHQSTLPVAAQLRRVIGRDMSTHENLRCPTSVRDSLCHELVAYSPYKGTWASSFQFDDAAFGDGHHKREERGNIVVSRSFRTPLRCSFGLRRHTATPRQAQETRVLRQLKEDPWQSDPCRFKSTYRPLRTEYSVHLRPFLLNQTHSPGWCRGTLAKGNRMYWKPRATI